MQVTLLVVVAFALAATPALAQDTERVEEREEIDYKFEVFGALGMGRLGADEGSRGRGPFFGGGVGFRPVSRVGFELEAGVLSNSRELPHSSFEGTAVLVSGNVLYHFSESRKQFYVIGGLGMLRTDQRREFKNLEVPDTQTFRSESFAVWNGGVGLKVFLTPKLMVRPEYRHFGGADELGIRSLGVMGMWRATVALGYYW